MKKTVAFHTLGCKLNFSETSSISRMFLENGYAKVGFDQPADVYVLNTCSVTENADKECRQIIRKLKRQSPDAKVAVVGCYAQLQPEQIAAIPGVSMVLGTAEKFPLLLQGCTLQPLNFKPPALRTAGSLMLTCKGHPCRHTGLLQQPEKFSQDYELIVR